MKTKNRLGDLINTRDLYVDYLRSNQESQSNHDVVLTMSDTLGLCAEITRLNNEIKSMQNLPLKDAEKEILFYGIEYPSKINTMFNPLPNVSIAKPKRKTKAAKQIPYIPSTWHRKF